jgi:nitrate reductase beta subunit
MNGESPRADAVNGSRDGTAGYLANILTAGDPAQIATALRRIIAMRAIKRQEQLQGAADPALAEAVGLRPDQVEHLFRLLAIARYDERYVIPKSHREEAGARQTEYCSLDFPGGPGFAEVFGRAEAGARGPRALTHRDQQGQLHLKVLGND